jgi:hypothetical protein
MQRDRIVKPVERVIQVRALRRRDGRRWKNAVFQAAWTRAGTSGGDPKRVIPRLAPI